MSLPELTLGIEEEYQIIDPESRELRSYIQEFLNQGQVVLEDQIKPELMQSQVEVGSKICRDIQEARQEIVRLRRTVYDVGADDFSLTSDIGDAAISFVIPVSGDAYDVTVSTGTGEGTIRLDVEDDDSITDAWARPLGGNGADNGGFTDATGV